MQHPEYLKPLDEVQRTKGPDNRKFWQTLVLQLAGSYIEGNTRFVPKTTALLKRYVPEAKMVLFSILDPHTRTEPHWGQYKGCRRYHLGIIIPDNNSHRNMHFRINAQARPNHTL